MKSDVINTFLMKKDSMILYENKIYFYNQESQIL